MADKSLNLAISGRSDGTIVTWFCWLGRTNDKELFMDIYARLKQDHEKQRVLCAKLEKTQGDSDERNSLWDELKVELEAHASAEEQSFYAELIQQPDATDKARHSVHEHQEMTKLIEELSELDMGSGGWLNKFKKLSHQVEHHLDEEEKEIFPLGRKVIDEATAKALTDKFNKRKPAEVKREEADA